MSQRVPFVAPARRRSHHDGWSAIVSTCISSKASSAWWLASVASKTTLVRSENQAFSGRWPHERRSFAIPAIGSRLVSCQSLSLRRRARAAWINQIEIRFSIQVRIAGRSIGFRKCLNRPHIRTTIQPRFIFVRSLQPFHQHHQFVGWRRAAEQISLGFGTPMLP